MEPRRILAVDWSGARTGARRRLWLAEARDGRITRLECDRSREELVAHVIELANEDASLVVGLDFAFAFPAWFTRSHGCESAPELWELVAREGERWLASCEPPFWGRPGRKRPRFGASSDDSASSGSSATDFALKKRSSTCGAPIGALSHERSPSAGSSNVFACGAWRATESALPPIRGVQPKSTFQIGGAGAVGTGSIRGMPFLATLRRAGFAIWPFVDPRLPLALEIYPRLLTRAVTKSDRGARELHLRTHAGDEDERFVRLAIDSEDAFDALVSARVMTNHRGSFAQLEPARSELERIEGRIWTPSSAHLGALASLG